MCSNYPGIQSIFNNEKLLFLIVKSGTFLSPPSPLLERTRKRRCGPVVKALGLHAVVLDSNPVLTFGQDLFPVVLDSTLPRFVNSQLVASCQLVSPIMFPLSLNCFF